MKKLIGICLVVFLLFVSAGQQMTQQQENKLYLKSSDYKSMQAYIKSANVIQPLQIIKTCFWRYQCQSGYEWSSQTHYYKCPFCGNSFVFSYYWCAGDPII